MSMMRITNDQLRILKEQTLSCTRIVDKYHPVGTSDVGRAFKDIKAFYTEIKGFSVDIVKAKFSGREIKRESLEACMSNAKVINEAKGALKGDVLENVFSKAFTCDDEDVSEIGATIDGLIECLDGILNSEAPPVVEDEAPGCNDACKAAKPPVGGYGAAKPDTSKVKGIRSSLKAFFVNMYSKKTNLGAIAMCLGILLTFIFIVFMI